MVGVAVMMCLRNGRSCLKERGCLEELSLRAEERRGAAWRSSPWGLRRGEGAMKEEGDISDSDSDETVVEGSVIESDLDEEELSMKRLSFVNKDISLTTESIFAAEMRRVNGVLENLSPEIQPVCKFSDYLKNMKQKNQINLLAHEMSETEQSQSLLQGAVFATKISQPGLPLNAVVGKQQNYAVGLEREMSGFLKTESKHYLMNRPKCSRKNRSKRN